MAKRELALQTDIVRSVRKDGGWARKISSQFQIGIPDLLIGLYPFIPVLAEVKDLADCVINFDRKLEITEKQKYELKTFDDVYNGNQSMYAKNKHASLIFVGIRHEEERRLVGLPWHAERLSSDYVLEPETYGNRAVGGYYDLRPIFEHLGIAKVKLL